MKSKTTTRFRALFKALPEDVQTQAREAYRLFRANVNDPILQLKRVRMIKGHPLFSVRILNTQYRALGYGRSPDLIEWGLIGKHTEYERMIQAYTAPHVNRSPSS